MLESLGELERSVMDQLWSAPAGMAATELRDALSDRGLALTTIHTVLSRLEKKHFVIRDRDQRPHTYAPESSREEYVAEVMRDALGQAPDKQAVLSRFLGGASSDETAFLRRLLNRTISTS